MSNCAKIIKKGACFSCFAFKITTFAQILENFAQACVCTSSTFRSSDKRQWTKWIPLYVLPRATGWCKWLNGLGTCINISPRPSDMTALLCEFTGPSGCEGFPLTPSEVWIFILAVWYFFQKENTVKFNKLIF